MHGALVSNRDRSRAAGPDRRRCAVAWWIWLVVVIAAVAAVAMVTLAVQAGRRSGTVIAVRRRRGGKGAR
ncbi:hypothetical protein KEF29_12635 [Streptomyces tuirus]|uniref:Uncharacterized protein n=1 Tax=Streptomyces tuirus TaxID=68278 RepID=A0A941F9E7_9ACTN|nr:hypothetical protein [Streptomyces tuirus]